MKQWEITRLIAIVAVAAGCLAGPARGNELPPPGFNSGEQVWNEMAATCRAIGKRLDRNDAGDFACINPTPTVSVSVSVSVSTNVRVNAPTPAAPPNVQPPQQKDARAETPDDTPGLSCENVADRVDRAQTMVADAKALLLAKMTDQKAAFIAETVTIDAGHLMVKMIDWADENGCLPAPLTEAEWPAKRATVLDSLRLLEAEAAALKGSITRDQKKARH